MSMMSELCKELRNYFLRDYHKDIHVGRFVVSDGCIEALPFLQAGQYFRIKGSVFNDGVHQYGACQLADETFVGEIWAMAVPPAVIALAQEIEDWQSENAEALKSPYYSESFGGYSYSKGQSSAGGASGSGGAYNWQTQFAGKLAHYRRVSEL